MSVAGVHGLFYSGLSRRTDPSQACMRRNSQAEQESTTNEEGSGGGGQVGIMGHQHPPQSGTLPSPPSLSLTPPLPGTPELLPTPLLPSGQD